MVGLAHFLRRTHICSRDSSGTTGQSLCAGEVVIRRATSTRSDGHFRNVDVEAGSSIRIVPGRVRAVGPRRIESVVVKREADVVAEFIRIADDVLPPVRGAGADLYIGQEGLPAIHADRAPQLDLHVRRIVPGVIPHDRDVSGRRIERDFRKHLRSRRGVVIDAKRCAPCDSVVVGEPEHDVGVVVLIHRFIGVNHVEPVVVRATGAIPRQARLGIDRAVRLRRDEVESADVCGRDRQLRSESTRGEAGRIDVRKDRRGSLAA